MGIQIGCVLVAEEGFQAMRKGEDYYFLKSNSETEIVRLVQFVWRGVTPISDTARKTRQSDPRPILVTLRRDTFEKGVETGAIKKVSDARSLPPWLESLVGKDLMAEDERRKRKRRSHLLSIDDRLQHLGPLLDRENEILCSDEPDKEINAHARRCLPRQNESRLRKWFYTYLLFGRNKFALHYATGNIGKWDRTLSSRKKQGRPSQYFGKLHGHHMDAASRKLIVEAYEERANLGMSVASIYREAMGKEFGCKVIKDSRGRRSYVHPKGKAFPGNSKVFLYHVNKSTGRAIVRRVKIGSNRERTENQPSAGRYTERVANLMEIVEADGYFIPELPRGYIDEQPLPSLCEVKLRDVASGMIVGIGFAQGSETAAAYLAALFCAAIDKVKLGELYGIVIRPEDWPSIGLSPFQITDRGVGATKKAQPRDRSVTSIFREMAPAYSGQSKAVIESVHPKQVSNKEAPSYIDSTLTPHELVKRSIIRVLAENDSMDIKSRVPTNLIPTITKTTPIGLWNALDGLGRNDAQTIAFDDAVRQFLPKHEATADADGIHFNGQLYNSPKLRKSDLLGRLTQREKCMKVEVFVLEACVRHIWLDLDGTLEELTFSHPLRSGEECSIMTLSEAVQLHDIQKENKARHDSHRDATITEFGDNYERQTGKKWNAAVRRQGKAKRGTKLAKQEASEAKRAMSGKLAK